jgi:hypothetical protein
MLELDKKKLDLLREILSFDFEGLIEYVLDRIEDKEWTREDLEKFNEILKELDLEEIEAYEDEEGD